MSSVLFPCGGGGGFLPAGEDLGKMFDHSFPACAFFFFFKWRLGRAHKFHSLCQDQSTVAQRVETTVAEYVCVCPCSRNVCPVIRNEIYVMAVTICQLEL